MRQDMQARRSVAERSTRWTRLSLVVAVGLTLASCHDARRSNPVDPGATPDLDIAVSAGDDGTALITWSPFTGEKVFSHYLLLRRNSARALVDTMAVFDEYSILHVSHPDTVARISDRGATSYSDTLVANLSFVYQVFVVGARGFISGSAESAPVPGPVTPRIAFYTTRDANAEVYLMNEDGSGLVNLTNHLGSDGVVTNVEGRPAWSPDGSKIAFVSNRDGDGEIYVMAADGSGPVNLTRNPAYDSFPSWSPDGSRIAFTSDRDGNQEIWVMDVDGTGLRQLTDTRGTNYGAAWSPDGARIAFTSTRDGTDAELEFELYVMNADGSEQTNLTNDSNSFDWDADWSPDGTRIAWEKRIQGNTEVFLMDADGSNAVNLTNDPAFDGWPDWSPDGTRIAFTSERDGNKEIYLMDADGSNPVRLTYDPSEDFFPDWQPALPP